MLIHSLCFCDLYMYACVRDRPFNLKGGGGGYGYLFRSEFFFRTTQELEYFFYLLRKARFFFLEFNIKIYDKNSESDIFFFLHQNQNIFFSNIGNQNIFLEKKTYPPPPPPLQVKWSFPNVCAILCEMCCLCIMCYVLIWDNDIFDYVFCFMYNTNVYTVIVNTYFYAVFWSYDSQCAERYLPHVH